MGKKEESKRNQLPQFQDLLYSYSNHDSVVLVAIDTWINGQNRKTRNIPTKIHPPNFLQECEKIQSKKAWPFQ